MNRLNIFVDETGEFGFGKGASELYGVSLVFHAQEADIRPALNILDKKFSNLGFHKMVHMGDLVMGHGDFSTMSIPERKKIFDCIYRFAANIPASYRTIIIDKKQTKNSHELSQAVYNSLSELAQNNLAYLQAFDKIVVYYDAGQAQLNSILNHIFGQFFSYEQKQTFDHTEKKLFQVADMLTYVDKILYKYRKSRRFTKTERSFFSIKKIKTIKNELSKHRF